MSLFQYLEKRNKAFWTFLSLGIVLVLGILDYLSGYEFAFSLFYSIPVALSTWFAGRKLGLLISGVSAIAWFLADILTGNAFSIVWLYLWNTFIRLGFFLIVTFLLTELRKSYKTQEELARVDFLTQATSTRYFYTLAETELERSRRYNHPLTLAYIDLDNFKTVNDRFGHSIGDNLLRSVADTVRHHSRNIDTFARLGGDEFAVLLPETGEVEAQAVISRIRRCLLEEMHRCGWPVTFSIGVVTFIKFPKTVDDMVKMADDVMYPIKNGSKDGISYTIYEG